MSIVVLCSLYALTPAVVICHFKDYLNKVKPIPCMVGSPRVAHPCLVSLYPGLEPAHHPIGMNYSSVSESPLEDKLVSLSSLSVC